jgi:hypothetical protein
MHTQQISQRTSRLRRLIIIGVLTLSILLVLAIGLSQAQGPAPGDEIGIQGTQMGTAFTYQGQLISGTQPVSGTCDFTFNLYDAPSVGTQIGITQTKGSIAVTNGLFTVNDLDFGSGAFNGEARWLSVDVRCPAGSGSYTSLDPRQPLTPAPYALALPGLWTQQKATSPNLIGGYSGNSVAGGAHGATIGGGGESGYINQVSGNYGTIGGGRDNLASGANATVGGGQGNKAITGTHTTVGGGYDNQASGQYATVGGGWNNEASADRATVGGGRDNLASGANATVGGGWNNKASSYAAAVGGGAGNRASGEAATVGGGWDNQASGYVATVGGGWINKASGDYATVGGGYNNEASGQYATVGGGRDNLASGDYSFAAGRRAKATSQGCFVWGDSTDANVACSDEDQFIVRASGGVTMYTKSNLSSGSFLAKGGSSWNAVSNRALKENFRPVDSSQLLARLGKIDITTWNYRAQSPAIRHIGPMADDFNGLVEGLGGEGADYINSLDADGVALAAIQGLYQLSQEQKTENATLRKEVSELKAENAAMREQLGDLEARLAALEGMGNRVSEGGGR